MRDRVRCEDSRGTQVTESGVAQNVSVTANEKSENQVFWLLGDAHEDSEPVKTKTNQSR